MVLAEPSRLPLAIFLMKRGRRCAWDRLRCMVRRSSRGSDWLPSARPVSNGRMQVREARSDLGRVRGLLEKTRRLAHRLFSAISFGCTRLPDLRRVHSVHGVLIIAIFPGEAESAQHAQSAFCDGIATLLLLYPVDCLLRRGGSTRLPPARDARALCLRPDCGSGR